MNVAGQLERILVLTASSGDDRAMETLLGRSGLTPVICGRAQVLLEELVAGGGCAIVAEEALGPAECSRLADELAAQPEWSDMPLILLTQPSRDAGLVVDRLWQTAQSRVTVLERPVRSSTLLAATHSALQSRRRQYQVRDELARRRAAEQSLRESDRRKDEFLATLGHELRNPLASLASTLAITGLADDAQTLAEGRAVMARQVAHLTRLVDDLLEISRITEGKLELKKTRVELGPIVDDVIGDLRAYIGDAGHTLTLSLPEDPIYLDADPVRVEQILNNLLTNAAKYTSAGGCIELSVEAAGGRARISVKDNGLGIPADKLDKVFEMFGQLDRSLETGYKGLGIGLSLVKSLVELHGGTIGARSEGLGKGSEFYLDLALAAAADAQEQSLADDTDTTGQSAGCRVLLVDDNRDVALSLAKLVSMLGHETEVAFDGHAAVAIAESFRPQLALLDIGLPGLSGYDVARHIRARSWGQGMMLAAVTGWGQDEDQKQAMLAGFDRHLTKPVSLATLRELLAAING